MKHYYITHRSFERGFKEVTEAEYLAFVGSKEARPYALKVYRNELSIEDVPSELQEEVQAVVNNKISLLGEYNKQEVSSSELKNMIEEAL